MAIPLGMLTTLIAPSAIAESSFAAMFLVGIGTAAGVMAFSVHGRFAPGLALGALGLFAYVTAPSFTTSATRSACLSRWRSPAA